MIKDLMKKIKENWVIIVLLLVVFLFSSVFSLFNTNFGSADSLSSEAGSYMGKSQVMYDYDAGFEAESEQRIKTIYSSLNVDVNYGDFDGSEAKLNEIVDNSNSIILNENKRSIGKKGSEYYISTYKIKVENSKYDEVLNLLKEIGEVKYFNENVQDITSEFTNLQLNLEVETQRLEKYNALFEQSKNIDDKLDLTNRIFEIERKIKYLQDSIDRKEEKVEYSTISFTLNEESPKFNSVKLVDFEDLIKSLVDSLNTLIYLIFVLIPWIALFIILKFGYKLIQKRN